MWKPDSREANHSHIWVDVLQNALRKEDQSHRDPNQQHAAEAFRGFEEELNDSSHNRRTI
jgi:hypothetical protein